MVTTAGVSDRRVVIVGASVAGASVAVGLRRAGFEGRVQLVGDEPHLPYDRPPLSKEILSGSWDRHRVALNPEETYRDLRIDLLLGAAAVALDPVAREVRLDDASVLSYDQLVIATGVRARRLPGFDGLSGVYVLRTIEDATEVGARLRDGGDLLIVGAGFIGLEVACAARKQNCHVTVLEPDPTPLARRIGTYFADRLLDLHRENGVEFRLGTYIASVNEEFGAFRGAGLSDGATVRADLAIVGVGTAPNVEWLEDAGLDVGSGVRCDETLRAAPGIFAAGDVASVWNPLSGTHERHEHRLTASAHSASVVRAILGQEPPERMPAFFWTDHYGHRVQMLGSVRDGSSFELVETDGSRFGSAVGVFRSGTSIDAVVGWDAAKRMAGYRSELARSMRKPSRQQ